MLKQLQAELPKVWTQETYSESFKKYHASDKNFRHALMHAVKAVGRLMEMPEESDHSGIEASGYNVIGLAEKYLADLVICCARMASEHPVSAIDLEGAVRERLEKKMSLVLGQSEGVRELLSRSWVGGTRVTNCAVHIGLPIGRRPDDCRLCLTDLRNHFDYCLKVNEWLNKWKDSAEALLKT